MAMPNTYHGHARGCHVEACPASAESAQISLLCCQPELVSGASAARTMAGAKRHPRRSRESDAARDGDDGSGLASCLGRQGETSSLVTIQHMSVSPSGRFDTSHGLYRHPQSLQAVVLPHPRGGPAARGHTPERRPRDPLVWAARTVPRSFHHSVCLVPFVQERRSHLCSVIPHLLCLYYSSH